MYNECLNCPAFGGELCKNRTYNSKECKKVQSEINKKLEEYEKTHCIQCGKRKDIPDGGSVVNEIYKKLKEDKSRYRQMDDFTGQGVQKEAEHLFDFVEYLYKKAGLEPGYKGADDDND